MSGLPRTLEPNLLVGYDSSDDAAVYRLTDELALIQTVDFFPPVVDDPYDFGQIAAANALSDVYAMGGEPRLAMNLLAVPSCLPREAVGAILEGGAAKVAEAGAVTGGAWPPSARARRDPQAEHNGLEAGVLLQHPAHGLAASAAQGYIAVLLPSVRVQREEAQQINRGLEHIKQAVLPHVVEAVLGPRCV